MDGPRALGVRPAEGLALLAADPEGGAAVERRVEAVDALARRLARRRLVVRASPELDGDGGVFLFG